MDLAELYPWPDEPWLRTMMVMTLDGATVGVDGRSGSISGSADKRVFMETRRLSDAVLVGAGTIRAERYKPMRVKPEWQTARSEVGLAPAPRIVVISGRLDLPWDEPMFTESALGVVVVTTRSVDSHRLAVAREFAEVWQLGDHEVDLESAVAMMREHGLARIVCEGGEALLNSLILAQLVDEMDLTVSPVLAGAGYLNDRGSQAQVLASAERSDRFARFAAAHTFMDEGFTFCKFLRKPLDEEFIV